MRILIQFKTEEFFEKSKEFLLENDESILDIALSVGYNNHTYYSSVFKKYNGMSPQEYRHTTLQ